MSMSLAIPTMYAEACPPACCDEEELQQAPAPYPDPGTAAAGRAPRSPAQGARERARLREQAEDAEREAWLYRQRTISLLRRYLRMAVECGRLPSLLGREFFRSHVTSYRATTFEEAVIFVIDMERCLKKLDDFSGMLLARLVLQEYTQEETAALLGCTRASVRWFLDTALDRLSVILLSVGLLRPDVRTAEERDDGDSSLAVEGGGGLRNFRR